MFNFAIWHVFLRPKRRSNTGIPKLLLNTLKTEVMAISLKKKKRVRNEEMHAAGVVFLINVCAHKSRPHRPLSHQCSRPPSAARAPAPPRRTLCPLHLIIPHDFTSLREFYFSRSIVHVSVHFLHVACVFFPPCFYF